jgi:riboflavin transporter FmnP
MHHHASKIRALVTVSLFAALAVVVSKLKVPIPIFHLRFEGSLAISLLVAASFGVKYGWYVEVTKYILNLAASHTFGVGETVDLLIGILAVWNFVCLCRRFWLSGVKSFRLVFVLWQIIFALLGGFAVNLIALPVYFWLFNFKLTANLLLSGALIGGIFSIVKVGLCCVLATFLQKSLPKSLQKSFLQKNNS